MPESNKAMRERVARTSQLAEENRRRMQKEIDRLNCTNHALHVEIKALEAEILGLKYDLSSLRAKRNESALHHSPHPSLLQKVGHFFRGDYHA